MEEKDALAIIEREMENEVIKVTLSDGQVYFVGSVVELEVKEQSILRGQILMIVEKHSIFQDGGSVNTYVLGSKQGFSAKDHSCSLKGCRLRGTVLDTDGERIKLHLEIDEDQDIDKAYWFEYAPQSGNVMYCMPQIGWI